MKNKIVVIVIMVVVTLSLIGFWILTMKNHGDELKYSCQKRCEPRRWLLISDHCYCRDMPDEWHGIDKDNQDKRDPAAETPVR